jgi:hypothetical protein
VQTKLIGERGYHRNVYDVGGNSTSLNPDTNIPTKITNAINLRTQELDHFFPVAKSMSLAENPGDVRLVHLPRPVSGGLIEAKSISCAYDRFIVAGVLNIFTAVKLHLSLPILDRWRNKLRQNSGWC